MLSLHGWLLAPSPLSSPLAADMQRRCSVFCLLIAAAYSSSSATESDKNAKEYDSDGVRAEAQALVEKNDLKGARKLLKHELSGVRKLAQTLPAVPQETFDEHSAVYLRLGQKVVPAIAGVLTDLGGVYQRLGQQTEGLAALEDATDLLRATYGDRDPRFGMTADKYADALVQNGQHQQALPIYRKLLHTMSTSLGVSHPGYQNTLSKLASAATAAGKHAYAAKSYAEMLGYIDNAIEQGAGRSDVNGDGAGGSSQADADDPFAGGGKEETSPEIAADNAASVRVQYARALANAGKLEEALLEGERARAAYASSRRLAGTVEHAMALNGVAGVLERLGRYDESIGQMTSAYELVKALPGASAEIVEGGRRNLEGLKQHIARKRKRASAQQTNRKSEL